MATSVVSSSEADLSSVADMEEEPLGELTDEELHNLLQETVYEINTVSSLFLSKF